MSGAADIDTADWHPRLVELYRYWRSIHPAHGLPGRQHLDPAAIPHLLSTIWMLDVRREPLRFRYRLVGTRIRERAGRELTGLWLDEAHPTTWQNPQAAARLEALVRTGIPSRRRGKPTLFYAHRDWREVENLMLPLATDGKTIDVILVITVFHE